MSTQEQLHLAKQSLYRRSFKNFAAAFWSTVCPTPLVWEKPQEAICQALQTLETGTLVINVPPGQSKSLLTTVLYPAWVWANDPTKTFITATHTSRLTERFAAKFRDLITSDQYLALFPTVVLSGDTASKLNQRNTAQGERLGVSVGGSITGFHADIIICDDLVDASEAYNADALETATEWHETVLSTRWKDENRKTEIVIAQRLSVDDLPGTLINLPGVIHLCLPAISESGELLAPIRLPKAVLAEKKIKLGTYGYSAQYLQSPVPTSGGLVKTEWLQHTYQQIPAKFDKLIFIIDCANSGEDDPTACLIAGIAGPRAYVLHYYCTQVDFPAALKDIEALKTKWSPQEICIEKASSGWALLQTLRSKFPNIIPLTPNGSKMERLSAALPCLEAGSVLFPPSAPWLKGFKDEVVGFPRAKHDESVDALAYLVNRYLVSKGSTSMDWDPAKIATLFGVG